MMVQKKGEAVFVKLTVPEAYQILAIYLDEDDQQALWFIKEKMARQIDRCLQPSCTLLRFGQDPRRCKADCRESREVCCVIGRRRPASPGVGLVEADKG
jgi:hypothetical protein